MVVVYGRVSQSTGVLRSARDQHEDCVVGSDLRFSFQVLRAESAFQHWTNSGKWEDHWNITNQHHSIPGDRLGNLLDNPEHRFFFELVNQSDMFNQQRKGHVSPEPGRYLPFWVGCGNPKKWNPTNEYWDINGMDINGLYIITNEYSIPQMAIYGFPLFWGGTISINIHQYPYGYRRENRDCYIGSLQTGIMMVIFHGIYNQLDPKWLWTWCILH